MPEYGQPYWTRRAGRPTRPRRGAGRAFKGAHTADVVVIGGGLTGCASAYALAKAGFSVTLLEADTIASGATSGGMGAVLPAPEVPWKAATKAAGARAARVSFAETQAAAKDFAQVLTRLRIACQLQGTDLLVNAPFTNDAALLRKEVSARTAAKLDAAWLAEPAARVRLATETRGVMRVRGAWTLDPVKAAVGLAEAARKLGATIIEGVTVKKTTFTRKTVTVVAGGATITATGVVVATGRPGPVFRQLERHVKVTQGYAVVTDPLTAAMRLTVGRRDGLYTEATESPRWLRWLADNRAMFTGLAGPEPPQAKRASAVVQRANQLMYELSLRYPDISGLPPAYGWDFPVVTTADGLPWIGPHRNYPFHFFAIALGWHGDAQAWLAARAAVRHFAGQAGRDDAFLGFARAL